MKYLACLIGIFLGSVLLCATGESTSSVQAERIVGAGIALFSHWAVFGRGRT